MALIYVWLRLSTLKQLDWHRGSSYQSKDIAHVQKALAQRMADKVRITQCCCSLMPAWTVRGAPCTQHPARRLRKRMLDQTSAGADATC